MPEMDGLEFLAIKKENPDMSAIPVIIITAEEGKDKQIETINMGADDYVIKPFIPEVVRARVRVHLKLYEANQRLQEINRQLQTSVSEQLKQMELEKKNVLYALIRVARENASYDEKHMERLSYNCRVLADAMQLSNLYGHIISDSYVDTIELAAPLCDLGNVAIPTSILQ